jgi:hypothetical protein
MCAVKTVQQSHSALASVVLLIAATSDALTADAQHFDVHYTRCSGSTACMLQPLRSVNCLPLINFDSKLQRDIAFEELPQLLFSFSL